MKLILVEAVYQSKYDDHPATTVIGVFSDREKANKGIAAYEALKRHWKADCLLEDTTYKFTNIKLDDYSQFNIP